MIRSGWQQPHDINIMGCIHNNPGEFSEFAKIINLAGAAGYLDADGTYTLFVPDNKAVSAYLQLHGKLIRR